MAVYLEDLTRIRLAQAITSTDGRYRFARIGAGTYYRRRFGRGPQRHPNPKKQCNNTQHKPNG
ncbi:MAG: hypothetical protein ACREBG_10190 [Pyrinomonadaceae bacterium]